MHLSDQQGFAFGTCLVFSPVLLLESATLIGFRRLCVCVCGCGVWVDSKTAVVFV